MLDTLVQDHFFQETLYIENGEYRDIDYERLRVIAQRNSTIEIRFGEMEHLVTYLALGRFITYVLMFLMSLDSPRERGNDGGKLVDGSLT